MKAEHKSPGRRCCPHYSFNYKHQEIFAYSIKIPLIDRFLESVKQRGILAESGQQGAVGNLEIPRRGKILGKAAKNK